MPARALLLLGVMMSSFHGACADDRGPDGSDASGNQSTTQAVCGDGVVESPEACDEGAENSDVAPDACRTDCTLPCWTPPRSPRSGPGSRIRYSIRVDGVFQPELVERLRSDLCG
jgi:hypothetical protein